MLKYMVLFVISRLDPCQLPVLVLILTLLPSSSVLEPLRLELLDPEPELGLSSAPSSLVMHGKALVFRSTY